MPRGVPKNGKRAPWSDESRQRMRELRLAHPQGNRSKEWWAAHPEYKAQVVARMWAGLRRRKANGGGGDGGSGLDERPNAVLG
jgi:hypothetical protein